MTYVPHNHSEDGSEIDMSVESVMMCNNTGSYHPDVALANFSDDASDDNNGSQAYDHSAMTPMCQWPLMLHQKYTVHQLRELP